MKDRFHAAELAQSTHCGSSAQRLHCQKADIQNTQESGMTDDVLPQLTNCQHLTDVNAGGECRENVRGGG